VKTLERGPCFNGYGKPVDPETGTGQPAGGEC